MVPQPSPAPETTERRLLALIRGGLLETPADFSPQSNLFSAGLDSMAIMQLLLAIEEKFGIEIPVGSVSRKNFETVEAVTRLVDGRLNGEAAPILAPCCAARGTLPPPPVASAAALKSSSM